jgi:excisionase family DNA binding protein
MKGMAAAPDNQPDPTHISVAIPDALVDEIAQRVAARASDSYASEPWITLPDAAEHMACPESRIYKLVRQKVLPHEKEGGRLLFRRSQLDSYICAGGATLEKYPGLKERLS